MAVSAASRVKLLDLPIAAPGVCALCGSATKPVVDFGKQLDWYGAVYFCTECIAEVSEVVGFIPVAKFIKLHDELRSTQIELDQLEKKYESVTDALRNVLDGRIDGAIDVDDVVGRIVSPVEKPDPATYTIEIPEQRNSEAEQSTSVEGSDDLFDASDFEPESDSGDDSK